MIDIKIEKGQGVHVIWLDSSSLGRGWIYEDEIGTHGIKPKVIESLGFAYDLTDQALALTSTRSKSGGIISPVIIPLCCIQDYSIIEL